jgi:hypothetical protein
MLHIPFVRIWWLFTRLSYGDILARFRLRQELTQVRQGYEHYFLTR